MSFSKAGGGAAPSVAKVTRAANTPARTAGLERSVRVFMALVDGHKIRVVQQHLHEAFAGALGRVG